VNKNEFKFIIAIAALAVASTIFFGGYWLYHQYGIDRPLTEKIEGIAGVKKVTINNKERQLSIEVSMKYVDNLQTKYDEIQEVMDSELKDGQYQLTIKDQRNAKLQKAYENVQLAVYEAIANNQYLWLKEQMKPELKGMTYRIFVDEDRLYIQMKDGDHFLYKVIDRQKENSVVK
jgi:hypothetical protein